MSTAPVLTELYGGDGSDLPAVVAIMDEAFDPAFGEAWSSAQCMGMMALQGVTLTLARHGGLVAGFAMSRVVAGDGELLLLAVRPAARRRGVGGALLRHVIADARDRAADRLHLEMRSGNPAAALYRAHGFTQVGQRRAYYRGTSGQAHDAHTYALPLGA